MAKETGRDTGTAPAPRAAAKVRNVALVGHAGAGKTTLAEALLVATGALPRAGRGEGGTTPPANAGGGGGHALPRQRGGGGPPAALGVARRRHGGARRHSRDAAGHPGVTGLRR